MNRRIYTSSAYRSTLKFEYIYVIRCQVVKEAVKGLKLHSIVAINGCPTHLTALHIKQRHNIIGNLLRGKDKRIDI